MSAIAPPDSLTATATDADLTSGRSELSFGQTRLWFLHQMNGASAAYNVPFGFRVRGDFKIRPFLHAVTEILRRHESLRTVFPTIDGKPIAKVLSPEAFQFPVKDLTVADSVDPMREVFLALQQQSLEPFDLTSPLLRLSVLRLGEEHYAIIGVVHHLVWDAWSAGVFVRELMALYPAFCAGERSPLPPLNLQYSDFAREQRNWLVGPGAEPQRKFWSKALEGFSDSLELPCDFAQPVRANHGGATHSFRVPPELQSILRQRIRDERCSLFIFLLTVFNMLLHRYSGQLDIAVGTSIANRNRIQTEDLIGYFVNTLVLRTRCEGEWKFSRLLQEVRSTVLDSFDNQDLPFEYLVEQLMPNREMDRNPLFRVMFMVQNASPGMLRLPGITLEPLVLPSQTTKFDLMLSFEESEGLTGNFEYATELFQPETIEKMGEHFLNLLRRVLECPDQEISRYDCLSAMEKQKLLKTWNDTSANYDLDQSVLQLIEAQAAEAPDRPAVVSEQLTLTYGQLNSRANQLARHLRSLGVDREVRVGVCLERSVELVVALLAVWKAGGAYVPLDPDYPPERLQFLHENACVSVLVVQDSLAGTLPLSHSRVVRMTQDEALISMHDSSNLGLKPFREGAAYVIYTSGSTGLPKGAVNTHEGLCNRLTWMQEQYLLTPQDIVLQKTPFSFDVSVWEFFWPLMVGARLVMAQPGGHRDAAYVVQVIEREQVTTIHFVPSMLQMFLEQPDLDRCRNLRRVICSGEALPKVLEEKFHSRLDAELHNLYGPTEASIDVTAWACQSGSPLKAVPIGRPIANTQIYLADPDMQPVPVGMVGELYIGGIGLARGYHGQSGLTAERFVPNPWSDSPGERLYRTGDLCRYLNDGAIEYIGRTDHQVKLRGFRIELGEIESVLMRHPEVRQSAVIARLEGGENRLLAFVSLRHPGRCEELELIAEWRRFLGATLPYYMIPSAFVIVEKLPLNSSGKIDRQMLLKAPLPGTAAKKAPQLPRTVVQLQLAGIWKEILGAQTVGLDDNFFALGGHSLLATRIVARCQKVFGHPFPLRWLFEHPTLGGFAELVEHHVGSGLELPPKIESIPRSSARKKYRASFAQERFWFLRKLGSIDSAYNLFWAVRIKGHLQVGAVAEALTELVRRHESLRTSFREADDHLIAEVNSAKSFRVPLINVALSPTQEADFAALLGREANKPFDLEKGGLFRVTLFCLSPGEHVLLLCCDHSVLDGWSVNVFLRELKVLYAAFLQGKPSPLPSPALRYADFAAWQRKRLEKIGPAQLKFWQQALADAPRHLELPVDKLPPPIPRHAGARLHWTVPTSLWRGLKQLNEREQVTMFMTVLAAFQLLLSRYSGQSDVVVGTVLANRDRPDLEDLVGVLLNTVALRSQIREEIPVHEFLQQVRRTVLDAFQNADLPFDRIVRELQADHDKNHSPLFQAALNFQSVEEEPQAEHFAGVTFSPCDIDHTTAKLNLTLSVTETRHGLLAAMEYNTDLFAESTIRRMLSHLQNILEQWIDNSDCAMADIKTLPPTETELQVNDWNRTETVTASVPSGLQLIEARAVECGDMTAVVSLDERLEYRELDQRANCLANRLIRMGVGPEILVGVYLERSPEMIVAILGILKAGGAFVPLDVHYPAERLSWIMGDSGLTRLVTSHRLKDRLPTNPLLNIYVEDMVCDRNEQKPPVTITPQNLAYVIYTSGSTGRPKGVQLQHEGLWNLVHAQNQGFEIAPGTRVLQFASIGFDASVWEIFTTLVSGGELHLADSEKLYPGSGLEEQLRGVNLVTLPPSVLAMVEDSGLEGLGTIVSAGEACPGQIAKKWSSGRRFINAYGPTEATVCASIKVLREEEMGTPTIGRPLANVKLYVLDSRFQPAPVGVPGMLYIGGVGVSRGYVNRPDLTAASFLPDPFSKCGGERLYCSGDLAKYRADGEIEYIGRKDRQVKIRGFRIEVDEIKEQLLAYDEVREVVVIVREDDPGEKRLVAYVVPKESLVTGVELDASVLKAYERRMIERLRAHVKARLPDFMLPSAYVLMDRLPLTSHQKIDVAKLPRPTISDTCSEGVLPVSADEETLMAIWSGLMGLEQVNRDDNFFELGGHSVLAARMMSRVREAFGVDLPLAAFFTCPTVAGLAEVIRSSGAPAEIEEPLVAQNRDGMIPLSFAQERLWFLHQWATESSSYNLSAAVRIRGSVDAERMQGALDKLVERHEILRTTFLALDGEPRQIIHATMAGHIQIFDLGEAGDLIEDEARNILATEARRHIDLVDGPLWRVLLLRFGDHENILGYTVHHAIADGWSMPLLIRELFALYAAPTKGAAELPKLPVQYADYSLWERKRLQGAFVEKQLSYWKSVLAGAPLFLDWPADFARPSHLTFDGQRQSLRLSTQLQRDLKELSRECGATLYMIMLAAFRILIYRYTGQSDVLIGTPVANRDRLELERVVGLLMNTLVIRNTLDATSSFRDTLDRERGAVLGALRHKDLPFEKLLLELSLKRDPSHDPVFQLLFTLQSESAAAPPLATGFDAEILPVENQTSRFDLSMAWMDTGQGLVGEVEYRTSLFRDSTITQLLGHYQTLLEDIVARPDGLITDLHLLPVTEQKALIQKAVAAVHRTAPPGGLSDRFEEQALRTPDRVAVVSGEISITYAELKDRVTQIATGLRARGLNNEQVVGIYMQHSVDMLVGVLSVLKAGAAYVPLNIDLPVERLKIMAEEAQVRFVLTDARQLNAAEFFAGPVLNIADVEGSPMTTLPQVDADWLAYVMFTSGSTGRPKGVEITHRSLTNFLESMAECPGITADDAVLSLTTLSFDIAGLELFLPLICGARVILLGPEAARNAEQIRAAVNTHKVTLMQATPATWRLLLENGWPGGHLRLLCGGEALSPDLASALLSRADELWNMYGPTETTIWSLVYRVKNVAGAIPIGTAIHNTDVYILDDAFNLMPPGAPGFLHLGGSGLARGYRNRPELTAERFIPNPKATVAGERLYNTGDVCRWRADGTLEFLGRRDHQVKIRGHRIELAEVQASLCAHSSVQQAVPIAWKDNSQELRLVAYVVLRASGNDGAASLRDFLQGKIPEYMIPSLFIFLPSIPLTSNGKVDRAALPDPNAFLTEISDAYIEPDTPTAKAIEEIWNEILGTHRAGLNSDFFVLGGHSLLAGQVAARIRKKFGVSLPLQTLFENSRLADLAKAVEVAQKHARHDGFTGEAIEEGTI